MSQRSEKLHRQVAQLRSDVDALQVAWLSQQHCDAVELAAAAERTRQAHRRASEAQRTARAWKLNAILTLILAALTAGVAVVVSVKAVAEEPTTPSSSAIIDDGRLFFQRTLLFWGVMLHPVLLRTNFSTSWMRME